jgi:hypothetical protein
VRSSASAHFALAFPLWIILGTQCFRIGVELFLHQLWVDGLVPKMLTFEGANVDIYVGASAPLIAWLSTRGRLGMRLALAWNALGLLALTNVVIRAVLTAPGPFNLIHAEVPNLMMGSFPFMFIPAFFVPLAVVVHVLAIRAINIRFNVWRITAKKRMVAKLNVIKAELQHRKHHRTSEVGAWLRKVVQGYYQYHAVPGNTGQLRVFRRRVCRLWRSVLVRRSQRAQVGWDRLNPLLNRWIPPPRVLHPYPDKRFDAIHPR